MRPHDLYNFQFCSLQEGFAMFDLEKVRIGVIGLGYVGLPLAVEFGKKFPTVGLDINEARVA